MASNTSAVVVSAQTMDATLLAAFGRTCGIYLYPLRAPGCISRDAVPSGQNSAFGNDYVVSVGYGVVMAITIPLGLLNLDDNIWVQIGGFVLLSLTIAVWSVQFIFYSGLSLARTPAFNVSGFAGALSTIAFNYGLILTIPSWLAEKGPAVRVNRSIWLALCVGTVQFFALGLLGAWALDFDNGNDVLAVLTDPATPHILLASKIGAFVLPLAALLTGIPIFAIIIRYNLLQIGVPLMPANFIAVGLPWGLSLIFFAGNQLADLITWSSALIAVVLNFVLPVTLYVIVMRASQAHDDAIRKARTASLDEEPLLLPAASGRAAPAGKAAASRQQLASLNAGGSDDGERAPASPPAASFWSRLTRSLTMPSPSTVDVRLEALGEAHRDDSLLGAPLGRLGSLEIASRLAPVIEATSAGTGARAAAIHSHAAGDALRLAPAADGEREEVEDRELVPLLSGRCCSPVALAWAIGALALALNFATLGLQIYGTVDPSASS